MPSALRSLILPAMTNTKARSGSVALKVNGERRAVPTGWSVADLLRALELDPHVVVVEHNRTILRDRSLLSSVALGEGDTLEIVHFVGGG